MGQLEATAEAASFCANFVHILAHVDKMKLRTFIIHCCAHVGNRHLSSLNNLKHLPAHFCQKKHMCDVHCVIHDRILLSNLKH